MASPGVNQNGFVSAFLRGAVAAAFLWTGHQVGTGHIFAQDFRGGPPGFGPPGGGDFRGFDRGRGEDYRDRSSRYESSGSRSPGSDSSSSSSSQSSAVTTPTRVRVTVGLQPAYADVDANKDGQIGLYEWKKARRPLAQFTQLDANKDGFLTPRELERAASLPMIASTPGAPPAGSPVLGSPVPGSQPMPGSPAPTGTPASSATVAATPKPAAPAFVSTLSEEDRTKADEAQAKSVFSILDKNKDGKISAEEIASSTRLGPLFQQAGVSFTEPMPADQFVSNYVRIQKSKRT